MGRPESIDNLPIPDYTKNYQQKKDNEAEEEVYKRPTHYKVMAIIVALFFSIGSHFATNTLNALKKPAKEQLGLTNSEYGIVQSMVYLINTIMPLFGGIIMDRFGTVYGAVGSSSFILFGNLIIAISSHLSKPFWLMVFGRILHGLGSGMIVVTQDIILGKWFSTSTIGIVIGLQISASRLANFSAQALANVIESAANSISGPLWVSAGACLISWLVTLLYAFYLNKQGGEYISKKAKLAPFNFKRLQQLPIGYWILPLATMVLAGVWTPFLGSVAEFITKNYADPAHTKEYTAINSGFKSSIALAISVILSPIMGLIVDLVGHRSIFLFASGICTTLSLLTFMVSSTQIALYIGLILFSVGLTIGPVPLTSSIALILPVDMIGTGMGVYKTAMSLGISYNHMFMGIVQDSSPKKDYVYVMPMLLAFSIFGIIVTIIYAIYSYKFAFKILEVPHRDRQQVINDHNDQLKIIRDTENLPNPSLIQKLISYLLLGLIVICWVFIITIIVLSRSDPKWMNGLANKFKAK